MGKVFAFRPAPRSVASDWLLVLVSASVIAWLSARPYAGSWNDGSRLAAAEALAERNTWSIDDSIFVRVPSDGPWPYAAEAMGLNVCGTLDKLCIDGRFYSDKPPVQAWLMAQVHKLNLACGGPTARQDPQFFCKWMTWCSSGLGLVLTALGVFALGGYLGLSRLMRWSLTLLGCVGSTALPYAQQVNQHGLLLGVASVYAALLVRWGQGITQAKQQGRPMRREDWIVLLWLGWFGGWAYTIDLAVGPLLWGCGGICVVARAWMLPQRRGHLWTVLSLYGLCSAGWIGLHHLWNYLIAGTIGPANAVPAYLHWPGSPFHAGNMTGRWKHPHFGAFCLYALDMLVGKKGFFPHQMFLWLAPASLWIAGRRRVNELPELLALSAWAVLAWLAYAVASNNYSGVCCSIRWLVPLVAAGIAVVAVGLRERPDWQNDGWCLGCFSLLMGLGMAWKGPWYGQVLPGFWLLYLGGLVTWGIVRWRASKSVRSGETTMPSRQPLDRAAA